MSPEPEVVEYRREAMTLRLDEVARLSWRRMHFCRKNGWGWKVRYRNRLIAALALRRAYRSKEEAA